MPELGRPTAEAGNLYHDLATIHLLLDMLGGVPMVDVWPEALAVVDDIRVHYASGSIEYRQVKEDSPGATWTARFLVREGVVGDFLHQWRAEPGASLIFVTAANARDFREITDRARNARANHLVVAESLVEWEARLARGLTSFVETIEKSLKIDRTTAFSFLCQVRVEDNQGTLQQRRDRARERLNGHVAQPARALAALENLARESAKTRHRITLGAVQSVLAGAAVGFRHTASGAPFDLAQYSAALAVEAEQLDVAGLPPLQVRVARSGVTEDLDPSKLGARVLLRAPHGAGKSRTTVLIARSWLATGRPGLHVRLGGWVNTLGGLLRAELSGALGEAASMTSVEALAAKPNAFLVLDGLDEIRAEARDEATLGIQEFARQFPALQVVVSTRPSAKRGLIGWDQVELAELTDAQITVVLGADRWRWTWPASIRTLIHLPLMLGLIRPLTTDHGYLPRSEVGLLADFIDSLVGREETRGGLPKALGVFVLQETAYGWLTTQPITLTASAFRDLSAEVARSVRDGGVATIDGEGVQAFVTSIGLASRLADGSVLPRHRSLLDHLAGQALFRRDPAALARVPVLREALAHFVALNDTVADPLIALLNVLCDADLELLARARSLASDEVKWLGTPGAYAETYVAAIRRLEADQLAGLRLAPEHVEVSIDKDVSWINERAVGDVDAVKVVASAERPEMRTAEGVSIPVQSLNATGLASRQIESGVPHFTAYDRISAALKSAVEKHLLPIEGPDLTYERLVRCRDHLLNISQMAGGAALPGLTPSAIREMTARQLRDAILTLVARVAGESARSRLRTSMFVFIPQTGQVALTTDAAESVVDARDPRGNRGGFVFHCASIEILTNAADGYGIADLPLHQLGLRPVGPADSLFSLPDRWHDLHGDQLVLFVRRYEEAAIRAYRDLVEGSLRGLLPALPRYQSSPWSVHAVIVDEERPAGLGPTVYRELTRAEGGASVVEVTLGPKPDRPDIGGWAALSTYQSLAKSVYSLLGSETQGVLRGEYSLGRQSL